MADRLKELLKESLEELTSTTFLEAVTPTTESLGPEMRDKFGAYKLEIWFLPVTAREGDLIVRLAGAVLPAVLRPTEVFWKEERCYMLVGPVVCAPNCREIMRRRKDRLRKERKNQGQTRTEITEETGETSYILV